MITVELSWTALEIVRKTRASSKSKERRMAKSWKGTRLFLVDFRGVQSNSYRPLRLSGVGSGSVVPLDGDRLARGARAGAARLGSGPVMRWGRVR